MSNDNIILIEEIGEPEDEGTPVIGIAQRADGSINYTSTLDPHKTFRILNGLANHILEEYIDG